MGLGGGNAAQKGGSAGRKAFSRALPMLGVFWRKYSENHSEFQMRRWIKCAAISC